MKVKELVLLLTEHHDPESEVVMWVKSDLYDIGYTNTSEETPGVVYITEV